ncbi:hypothetical protein [Geomicrobium sp. JCM 19039]|uniref:hypothetical protein n=1 Tax=Geomicrobium sp. JCM 19039 TaxID=1460636 RepID=UPI00045F1A2B|nr:hypothetical protein [Geomicrobium sp. JCM 19039]GAK14356.1 hypothetical protein JCM19039_4270 [Geomicrobium sp. JCM 19039]
MDKAELLQKYREKNEQRVAARSNIHNVNRATEQPTKDRTKKMKQLENNLKRERKKNEDLRSERDSLKRKQHHFKQKISEQSVQLADERASHSETKETLHHAEKRISALQAQLEVQRTELVHMNQIKELHQKQSQRIRDLKQHNQRQKEALWQLKSQPSTFSAHAKKEIAQLNRKIHELHELKDVKHTPESLVSKLRLGMNAQNIDQLFTNGENQLARLAETAEELKKARHRHVSRTSPSSPNPHTHYGHIEKKNGRLFFITLSNEAFQAESNTDVTDGTPVNATIRNKIAYVNQVLHLNVRKTKKLARKKKTAYGRRPLVAGQHIGSFHVLLVGSKRLNRYKARLEEHGLQVTVINPYEENYHRLLHVHYDLAILLTAHAPHAIYHYFNTASARVETMKHDNEENIVARVRFFAKQQEWRKDRVLEHRFE